MTRHLGRAGGSPNIRRPPSVMRSWCLSPPDARPQRKPYSIFVGQRLGTHAGVRQAFDSPGPTLQQQKKTGTVPILAEQREWTVPFSVTVSIPRAVAKPLYLGSITDPQGASTLLCSEICKPWMIYRSERVQRPAHNRGRAGSSTSWGAIRSFNRKANGLRGS